MNDALALNLEDFNLLMQALDVANVEAEGLPDAAWFSFMEGSVRIWRDHNNSNVDPYSSVMEWLMINGE